MSRPKGEDHPKAVITSRIASEIKERVFAGETIDEVCDSMGVKYQTAYKIATGATWKDVKPSGSVLNCYNRSSPGPNRKFNLRVQHYLWSKRRDGVGTKLLAEKTKMDPSSIRRLIAEFELILSHRISSLHLSSGAYDVVESKYGIPTSMASDIDAKHSNKPLSPAQRKVLETEFPELEKQLKGKV